MATATGTGAETGVREPVGREVPGLRPALDPVAASVSRARAGATRVVLILAGLAGAAGVEAQNWRFGASAGVTETYTNNVFYAPQGQAAGDWVTSLTGAITVRGEGARVKLNGSVAATLNIYAKETGENSIAPNVNLAGSVEAIEKFFFVDASANVSTQFLSPFGPQPGSIVNATDNRYISQTYSISPYIKGVFGATNVSYQVRNTSVWTLSSPFGSSTSQTPSTFSNNLNASLTSANYPMGWIVEYNRYTYDSGVTMAVTWKTTAATRSRSPAPSCRTRSIRRCSCRPGSATRTTSSW